MAQVTGQYDAAAMMPGTAGLRAGDRTPAGLHKAAVEFESVLLGQWLQSAEKSFADVPGGGGEEEDAGGEQMMSFAMQQLAGGLAARGGLGIAKLVEAGLARAQGEGGEVGSQGTAGANDRGTR